ncbi:MAG: intermembrane phospholipid transport protein YdbH family protein [Lentimonas sp.]
MRIRCLKFIFYLILLTAVVVCVLLYNVATLVELSVNQIISERGGNIKIERIALRPMSGLTIVIDKYSEPAIELQGLQVEVPLFALIQYKNRLALRVNIQQLSLELPEVADTHRQPTVGELMEKAQALVVEGCQAIVSNLNQLTLQGLELTIADLHIVSDQLTYQSSLSVDFDKDTNGKVVSTIRSESDYVGLQAQINIDRASETVAVDFSMSARKWEAMTEHYLSPLDEALSQYDAELYIDPLPSASFLEVSGYFRWTAQEKSQFNAAILGNVGASEVLMDSIECSMKPTSFGIATDGRDVFRVYLNLPLEQLYVGAETYEAGEISLRIENNQGTVKAILDDNFVELSNIGFVSLFKGFGQIDYNVQFNRLGSALFSSRTTDVLPIDLEFAASVHASGSLSLQEWGIFAVASEVTWGMHDLTWSSKSLTADEISGVAKLAYEKGFSQGVNTSIHADTMNIAGIDLSGLTLKVDTTDLDTVGIRNFNLNALGGTIHAVDFTLKIEDRSSDPVLLSLNQIQLEELAKVVPQFDGELKGSVSGELIIQSKPSGFQINRGGLELDSEKGAYLSYSMNGLLTQGLQPGTDAYLQYQLAERALEDLSLQRFHIDFFPNSDETKPILLNFSGESAQGGTIVPIDYNLNINTNDSAEIIQLLQMMQRGELELN